MIVTVYTVSIVNTNGEIETDLTTRAYEFKTWREQLLERGVPFGAFAFELTATQDETATEYHHASGPAIMIREAPV